MIIPTEDLRRTDIPMPKPLLKGLDALVHGMSGRRKGSGSLLPSLLESAADIERNQSRWTDLGEHALKTELAGYKAAFRRRKRGFEDLVPSALGALREAARRALGLRPYEVQLAGAMALYRGYVVEMATGEGKTLTAALAACLRGWAGLPCHVITVNDYLADRDAGFLEKFYRLCGLSAGCVTGSMQPGDRREGYSKDIAYTTSKEIVADFLRDRIVLGPMQKAGRRQIRAAFGRFRDPDRGLVMRGLHSAIVDEADSILIDEGVTPLIISKPQENEAFVAACRAAGDAVAGLSPGLDYRVDPRYKEIELLPALEDRLSDLARQLPEMYRGSTRCRELVRQALTAREFFHRDGQYVLQNGKIVIVDEFTGRLMPQRTWRAGLHQLIEAKEAMDITPPSETLARLSFQRFFRFFRALSGMTGTAREAAPELWHIYGLPVIAIPPNKPCLRKVLPRRIFPDREAKFQALIEEIAAMHRAGRPVLVGTRSVKTSEEVADRLKAIGLSARVLNAVRHQEEALVVRQAGAEGIITVATNMAGRGTDIRLDPGVGDRGGLHVIATECHESARIDRQLFGRCSRQGDPGSARAYVSLDDELMTRYLSLPVRQAVKAALKSGSRQAEWLGGKAVEWAQASAQRQAYRRRRAVLKMDTWIDDSLSFAGGEPA